MNKTKNIPFLILLLFCVSACRESTQRITKTLPSFTFADNKVVAHRGAWKAKNLPQNSIAAFRHAVDLGCVGSEFDVRMTADQVLIVTHDADYHGMQVEESTYAQLAKVKLPNGEILPKLKDFIAAGLKDNPATGLVCEIKPSKYKDRNPILAERAVNIVKALNAENHILSYISFSYDILLKIKELDPKAKIQYLDGSKSPVGLKADGISGLDYLVYKLRKKPEWVKSAKENGLILNAWTANKVEDIDWLIANGFDYITTDEPELTFKRLKQNPSIEMENNNLSVMTYNIRLDVASDGENAWPNRKDFLTSQVQFYGPDIMGVQEARPNQMIDLKNVLQNYQTIGTGRDGENKGEFSAIFYNADKFKVENHHTFWLSETPDEISKGWDAAYPRICSYGLFTALKTGQQFWVFNTHLDHKGPQAQLEGIQLILKKIAELNTSNFPVVLMGDFNVEPDSKLILNLKEKMNDAREIAKVAFGANGTFNGFKFKEPVTRRIDYIMLSKSNLKVNKYGVLSSAIDLKYPSDHFPVMVYLSF